MKRPPTKESYPHLYRLFAAYVDQDWDRYGPSPEDAVRQFASETSAADRAATAQEVEKLLAEVKTEKSLDRALSGLRCGYLPSADGKTNTAWLTSVSRLLRAK